MWNELPGTERGHSQRPGCQKLCVSAVLTSCSHTIYHRAPSAVYAGVYSCTKCYILVLADKKDNVQAMVIIGIILTMTGWLCFFTLNITLN